MGASYELRIWIGNLPEDCTWQDLQTLGNTVAATRWAEVFRGKGGLREISCSKSQ